MTNDRDRHGHPQAHAHGAVDRRASGRARADQAVPRGGMRWKAAAWARPRSTVSACGRSRTAGTCRGALERFLIGRGERSCASRPSSPPERGARPERGKSDAIDAVAIARAALREGSTRSPGAPRRRRARHSPARRPSRTIAARTADQQRLRWHLHDLWPETVIPPRLHAQVARQDRPPPGPRRTSDPRAVARDELRRIREHYPHLNELQAELAGAGRQLRAAAARRTRMRLTDRRQADRRDRRCHRFSSDAKLARTAGPHQSPPPPDAPTATASITAATAR